MQLKSNVNYRKFRNPICESFSINSLQFFIMKLGKLAYLSEVVAYCHFALNANILLDDFIKIKDQQ